MGSWPNGDEGNGAVEADVKKRAVELCERYPHLPVRVVRVEQRRAVAHAMPLLRQHQHASEGLAS